MWFGRASTVSSAEPLTTRKNIEGRSNLLLLYCHKIKWVCIGGSSRVFGYLVFRCETGGCLD